MYSLFVPTSGLVSTVDTAGDLELSFNNAKQRKYDLNHTSMILTSTSVSFVAFLEAGGCSQHL